MKKSQRQSVHSTVSKDLTTPTATTPTSTTKPCATTCQDKKKKPKISVARANREKKLKNTFGWARIDIMMMLICCVFLSSFAFSIVVEALQTLVHIDHQDAIHHPFSVMCIGVAGLLLNLICYVLIGGYTFHHASYLRVTAAGDVVLDRVVVAAHGGGRRLSRTRRTHPTVQADRKLRQGVCETIRDITGCILVIVCSVLVIFADKDITKFIDPVLSLISVCTIMTLSYPYMKESCLILLQTMPDTIDIDTLKADLLTHFPDIVNIHDVHVWQLTANKVISTVHIIFQNPKVYNKIMEEVKSFFIEKGITQVTIQPEFYKTHPSTESLNKLIPDCLMACQGELCKENHCCPDIVEKEREKKPFKSSKEILPESWTPDLRAIRIMNDETTKAYTISSSLNNSLAYEVARHNKINKSFDEIPKERDIINNKIIPDSEARIDAKINRILSRSQRPLSQNTDQKEEEMTLNVERLSKSVSTLDECKLDHDNHVHKPLRVCEHMEQKTHSKENAKISDHEHSVSEESVGETK
ncbi:unnamed protein product [Acanthoscelides obtectus]|nr:unnamed protein product [Acanthoscelides obtectus]CAK1661513.1 Zinc/cadmium resistance protein [Acanthoscelides obtectus]